MENLFCQIPILALLLALHHFKYKQKHLEQEQVLINSSFNLHTAEETNLRNLK